MIYLVHARRMRMKMLEIELVAASGINEHNTKLISEITDTYRNLLFPGVSKERTTTFEEQAKKLLAEEVKKVYRMQKINDPRERDAEMKKIIGAGGAGGAMAATATYQEERAMAELQRRKTKR